jgi:hypothetical protein|tara:strand:+ start:1206 stop:1598 length:393 start_codon:yes stop_codon:yes gene_type:complete
MEKEIKSQKTALRVLIILGLVVTSCLVLLNPATVSPVETKQINYLAIIGLLFYLISLTLLFIFNSWGKIFFTIYVLEGLIARWYGPEYAEPSDSLFLLFTYIEGMIEGAILALIFLAPISKLFKSVKGHL